MFLPFNLNCLFSFFSWLGCSWRSSKLGFSKLGSKNVGLFFAISSRAKKENNIKTGCPRGSDHVYGTLPPNSLCAPTAPNPKSNCASPGCYASRIVVAFGNLCCSVLAILTSLSGKKRASTCALVVRSESGPATITTTRGLCLKNGSFPGCGNGNLHV